ncbi:unnamed protein product [Victoria cruziana]
MEDAESSTAAGGGFRVSRSTANKRIRDRIGRAMEQRLILLHRSSTSPYYATFYVLGATGNVYTVTISTTPSCTCPDPVSPCKHILFVFLRVLGLPPSDYRLRCKTLSHFEVFRALVATEADTAVLAGPKLLSRFRQIFSAGDAVPRDFSAQGEVEDRAEESEEEVCPVCLEKIERKREPVAVCVTCKNVVHAACFERWKKSRARRVVTCVMCRARWKTRNREGEKYVNLEAFVEGAP